MNTSIKHDINEASNHKEDNDCKQVKQLVPPLLVLPGMKVTAETVRDRGANQKLLKYDTTISSLVQSAKPM